MNAKDYENPSIPHPKSCEPDQSLHSARYCISAVEGVVWCMRPGISMLELDK